MPNQVARAEIILLEKGEKVTKWKVHVTYDHDMYLVLVTDKMVAVYKEQDLPESSGTTLAWPTHMTGVRAVAIESVRRVRFGDVD